MKYELKEFINKICLRRINDGLNTIHRIVVHCKIISVIIIRYF